MNDILFRAIENVQTCIISFSKFITANDTGATGAHQAGYHIHKESWPLFFDNPGVKGENKDKYITIRWQGDFETISRCIYYGVGTRNEYRLTRFGKGFPYLNDENIGDLLVISKVDDDFYEAVVLHSDEDIDEFLATLNISSTDINGIIPKQFETNALGMLMVCFSKYIASIREEFPPTIELANNSRLCYNRAHGMGTSQIKMSPDTILLGWLDAEFQLFKALENNRYSRRISIPFNSVEELVDVANTILNRRKSRAGKSLEHHLSEVFTSFDLRFNTQVVTEFNKRPDFLFPGIEEYSNPRYPNSKLLVLASKTTCKDRWRQILNEADRVPVKHLFTLQQGISRNQLEEMYHHNVCLVVPKQYVKSFPPEFRDKIRTLESFISLVQHTQKV